MSGANEQHDLKSKLKKSDSELLDANDKIQALEEDLKIEREWRERLQTGAVADKEEISQHKEENKFLKKVQQVSI